MKMMNKIDKIDELLTRRVDKIYPSRKALEKVLRSGKKLKLYQGFDPSTPNLHIGHLVGLLKLKQFQQLGHEVIFLVGDFTGMIGDPTGKIKGARPQLSQKQVLKNARTYKQQAGMVLDFSGKNPIKIKYNSQWLAKLRAVEVASLMRHLTYSQVIKRDMFQQRIKEGKDILVSEFFYPFLQAYDSVYLDVDLEIGGSDQMFNMLVGRDLMKKLKGKEKFVMTTMLLADSRGNKIGKTEGNAINITHPPQILFGQIMSLTDDCILPCLELATELPLSRIKEIEKSLKANKNPMIFKKELAFELVKMLYSKRKSQKAQEEFEERFQKKKALNPTQIRIKTGAMSLVGFLLHAGLASSKSEAKRLIRQNSVKILPPGSTDFSQAQTASLATKVKTGEIIKVGKLKIVKLIK